MTKTDIIPPGSTIGILGGGQLGKMTAMAAARLGYEALVWGQSPAEPALQCAADRVVGTFDSMSAFCDFVGAKPRVITVEWENVAIPLLERLEQQGHIVRPSSTILSIAQSRRAEKSYAQSFGFTPTPWCSIEHAAAIEAPDRYRHLLPGILKTDRNGYDGKGQRGVTSFDALTAAVREFGVSCILEKRLAIDFECSVLVARNARGETSVSDLVINEHSGGILSRTIWAPDLAELKRVSPGIRDLARNLAEVFRLEGVLALEFIVSDGMIYFNEMAPRPHNSFHASIEAARCSQFEQHVRAICNLPLGNVTFHTRFDMRNLIGDEWLHWEKCVGQDDCSVHLYGKGESRPGRKMGHVTFLYR